MESNFSNLTNTVSPPPTLYPVYAGYIALLITCIFWGSFFLPVKRFETGDGVFFQMFICLGIWTVSYIVNCIRNFPVFYGLAMLCGVSWSAGNLLGVPTIKFIGLSLGPPIWSVSSLITGWSIARFGLFGNKPQVPKNIIMNYIGVAIAALSAVFYLFVKTQVNKAESKEKKPSSIDNLNPALKRILGISFAIISGICYGLNYAPILYIMDNYDGASQNGLDYLYSFCSGTLISAIVFLLIYCVVKKNKPMVYGDIILPAFTSGIMWAIANLCFLIASDSLSQAVIFPIGMVGSPMVATLWGILVFKEIRGKRNLIVLAIGFVFTIVGSVLSGLSK